MDFEGMQGLLKVGLGYEYGKTYLFYLALVMSSS